jgi:predicted DNA-binding transcriptional regulator YafY
MLYTIEISQLPDSISGDWATPEFQAVLRDKNGDGIVTSGGSPRALAVKAIARYEAMQEAEKTRKDGGDLRLASVSEMMEQGVPQNDITETHENSPTVRHVAVTPAEIEKLLKRHIDADPVRILYKGEKDTTALWRTIDVYGIDYSALLHRQVAAYCYTAGARRSFRLDRIERAEVA